MSRMLLRLLIILIFLVSTIIFIVRNDYTFAVIFGIIFIVFVLRLMQGINNNKKY